MTACIFYHPEAYTTSGPRLMGRNAAGESFLRGFITHSKLYEFWVQTDKKEFAQHFARTARAYGRQEQVNWVETKNLHALSKPGLVFNPGPGLAEQAWQRSLFGHGLWSLCGITHTTSSAAAMDSIAGTLTAPVYPWDAIICTSTAVRQNVINILDAQTEFLKDRLGATRLILPQLPVIPLGIHTQDFVFTAEQKAQARRILNVDSETIVVLFMGRLSFHAKAHPLAMYQALQSASIQTGKKVVLLECGWHANEHLAEAFRMASLRVCPNVNVMTLDGRIPENRLAAWAGSDICCSLSDNIQETFGIVPIEGMAAGLPIVVTDWDGYKDTVRDGVDGFRVPTIMPPPGSGGDLAGRHALGLDNYDNYLGNTCSLVGVDIEATTRAFVQLINSPELRNSMGNAGRQRARALFDWEVIIPQYEQLWEQQNQMRQRDAAQFKALDAPWPARMDPFTAFAGYSTSVLTSDTWIALVDKSHEQARQRLNVLKDLTMSSFARYVIPNDEQVATLLLKLARGPVQINQLLASVDIPIRSLGWLLKMGVIKVVKK